MHPDFDYSEDSEFDLEFELIHAKAIDVKPGSILNFKAPESITHLIPQSKDVLVLTNDGRSFLLKNFLLVQDSLIELPNAPAIVPEDFKKDPVADLNEAIEDTNSSDYTPLAVKVDDSNPTLIQKVALLSVISQLGQQSFAGSLPELSEDGHMTADFRDFFETLEPSQAIRSDENLPSLAERSSESQAAPLVNEAPSSDEKDESPESNASEAPPADSNPSDPEHLSIRHELVDSPQSEDSIESTEEVSVDNTDLDATSIQSEDTDPRIEMQDEEATPALRNPFNDANVSLSLSSSTIVENEPGCVIGEITLEGEGLEGDFTFAVTGDHADRFEFVDNVLKLKDGESIDFETSQEAFDVEIRVSNASGADIQKSVSLATQDLNEAAQVSDISLQGEEDFSITLQSETFEHTFEDFDYNDKLVSIRIDTLPQSGVLKIDDEAMEAGQVVAIEDVSSIRFVPDRNWYGETEFSWSGSDGELWSERPASVIIDIESINDAPTTTFSIGTQIANEDASFSLLIPRQFFSDPDEGDTLTYTVRLPRWLSYNSNSNVISGVPSYDKIGEHRIEITATDTQNASVKTSFILKVENVNDVPLLRHIPNFEFGENESIDIDIAAYAYDQDLLHGDTLTYSATLEDRTSLPDWIRIDASTGRITGRPPQGEDTSIGLRVTVTDSEGEGVSSLFDLKIQNENDAPELAEKIDNATAWEKSGFEYDVSKSFSDPDLNDTLSYAATLPDGTELPKWLEFDSESGIFSGTPTESDLGMVPVRVVASDGQETVEDIFAIFVEAAENGVVATAVTSKPQETSAADNSFSLELSESFPDLSGDEIHYSASPLNGAELPEWLTLDEDSGQLSGEPGMPDLGSLSILVIASDGSRNANEIVCIEVEETEGTPRASLVVEQLDFTHEARSFLFDASSSLIHHDSGDQINFTASLEDGSPLPDWLWVDPNSGELQGALSRGVKGETCVKIAAEKNGYTCVGTFAVSVEDFGEGPIVSAGLIELRDESASQLELNIVQIEESIEAVAKAAYSATLSDGSDLPSWLTIDPGTGELAGSPDDDEPQTLAINLVVSDGEESISDTITLSFPNSDADTREVADDTTYEFDGLDQASQSVLGIDFSDTKDIELDFSNLDKGATSINSNLDRNESGASVLRLGADDVLDMANGENRLFYDADDVNRIEISSDYSKQGSEVHNGVDYTHFYDPVSDTHLYINSNINELDTF